MSHAVFADTSLNSNDPRPAYIQIADLIKRFIAEGALSPGARIPPARVLAEGFGVAVMTVSGAIRHLKEEGVLVSWSGRGVFVADPDGKTAQGDEAKLGDKVAAIRDQIELLQDTIIRMERDLHYIKSVVQAQFDR